MNLRKEARNRPCQVRIPGVCNGNWETTVLAHYRLPGTCGTGIKPPDLLGAWACAACHSEIDGRTYSGTLSREELKAAFAEGVMRTIYTLIQEGKV